MEINISYKTAPPRTTDRTREVHEQFGIGHSGSQYEVVKGLTLDPVPGEIVLLTGPSGSGKSSILRELVRGTPGTIDLDDVAFDERASVVDQFDCPLEDAMSFLARAGLSDAFLFLRCPSELSDGQRYRLRLALALSSGAKFVAADEFCATLDRLTARIIAYQVRCFARRTGMGFFLATTHEDFIDDLQPDTVVHKGVGPKVDVEHRETIDREPSFLESITIEEGTTDDWRAFAPFHYKSHFAGAVDRVFVMRLADELVAVAVYSYPQRQLRLRNLVTDGRYAGALTSREKLRLLNCELRLLSRVVVDPRMRGLGLGAKIVAETVRLLGVRFVEALAVMGGTNRFLDRAGFTCVGRCRVPRPGRALAHHIVEVLGLSQDELHDPAVLAATLKDNLGVDLELSKLLDDWWKAYSATKRPVGARVRLDVDGAAKVLAREATSRPWYFILDLGGAA